MTKRILAVISAVCLVVGLAYGASKTMHQARAAQSVDWGMYDTNYPSDMSRINSLNTSLGRNAHIIHWYREWSESCGSDPASLQQQVGLGNIPMITWETYNGTSNSQNPYPLSQIAAGNFDSYIDSCANAFKAAGGTMYLRVDQEMNDGCCNGGYPWSVAPGNPFGNTPANYAQAYQHIVNRLRGDGATNVKFIWNADGDIGNHPIPSGTYPGDASIDFIGFDYYDFSGTPFQNDYNLIVQQPSSRPVFIGEMGASPSNSQYINYITNAVNAGTVPRLAALVWFNESGQTLQVGSATFNSLKNLLAITGGPTPTPTPTPMPTPTSTPTSTPTPTPTPTSTPTPTPTPTPSGGPVACSSGGNQLVTTTSPHPMGGIATSSVAGVSWDKNQRLDAFVRGTDGAIWHTASANDGTNWSAWESLGGGILSGTSPSVASWGVGRLDVFVTGSDNQLWQKTWNGSWSGWAPLGGYLDNASPTAVSWGLNRIDLMVRSTNGAAWHRSYSGGWSDWEPQGGVLSSAPAAASQASGTLDFITHAGSQVWKDSWTGSAWTGWTLVGSGSNVIGDPAVGSCANGHLAVIDDGTSSALHYLGFASSWSQWNALNLTGNGPGLANSGGYLDLFDTGVPNSAPQHYRVGATT